MSTNHRRVRAYYDSFDEWKRLDSPEGSIEYRRTLEILGTHLSPRSRVLDLGGGPGRYSADLAHRGHQVVLADVSPALLAIAREKFSRLDLEANIESIDEINALDLGVYPSESFDAVLALGPFYHLISHDERSRAAAEVHRVLQPRGLAFVAYIPRLSGIVGLIERAAERPEQVPADTLRAAADTGVFRNASSDGFQEGYYPWPGEIEALFEAENFQVIDSVSLKSVAHGLGEHSAKLDDARRAEVDHLIDALSRRPEVVAMCGHIMMIAKKCKHDVTERTAH